MNDEREPITRRRRDFWRCAAQGGWKWLGGVFGHVERAIALVAILGLPLGGIALLDFGWWAALAGVAVALLLALAEGAFVTWQRVAEALDVREREAELRRKLADACFKWIEEVETFLDARYAGEPFGPQGGLREQVMNPHSPTAEQRDARETYRRETVSLYIERYRKSGTHWFDTLVTLGHLNNSGRKTVNSPRTPDEIRDAVDTMRFGAERV